MPSAKAKIYTKKLRNAKSFNHNDDKGQGEGFGVEPDIAKLKVLSIKGCEEQTTESELFAIVVCQWKKEKHKLDVDSTCMVLAGCGVSVANLFTHKRKTVQDGS